MASGCTETQFVAIHHPRFQIIIRKVLFRVLKIENCPPSWGYFCNSMDQNAIIPLKGYFCNFLRIADFGGYFRKDQALPPL